jgi:flagellar biosynthesis GTPase FlhF
VGGRQKKDSEFTDEGLKLTERLLDFNSDCYTIWNFRRLILLNKIREANEEQVRLNLEAIQQPSQEKEQAASEQAVAAKTEETEEQQKQEETKEETKSEHETKDDHSEEQKEQQQEEASKGDEGGEQKTEEEKPEEKKELTEEEKKELLDKQLKQIEENMIKRLCAQFERELDAITSPAIKRNPKCVLCTTTIESIRLWLWSSHVHTL